MLRGSKPVSYRDLLRVGKSSYDIGTLSKNGESNGQEHEKQAKLGFYMDITSYWFRICIGYTFFGP